MSVAACPFDNPALISQQLYFFITDEISDNGSYFKTLKKKIMLIIMTRKQSCELMTASSNKIHLY